MPKVKYTFADGKVVDYEEIPIFDVNTDDGHLFKINLSDNNEDYLNGNGEGVWAIGNRDTMKAHKDNELGNNIYFVRILNDSVYYPGLMCDTVVPIKFRGDKRPVALMSELQYRYGAGQRECFLKQMRDATIGDSNV